MSQLLGPFFGGSAGGAVDKRGKASGTTVLFLVVSFTVLPFMVIYIYIFGGIYSSGYGSTGTRKALLVLVFQRFLRNGVFPMVF